MSALNAALSFPKRKFKRWYIIYYSRGLNSSNLSSDSYTLYFWDILHSDPLFSSLNRLNDFVRSYKSKISLSLRKKTSCASETSTRRLKKSCLNPIPSASSIFQIPSSLTYMNLLMKSSKCSSLTTPTLTTSLMMRRHIGLVGKGCDRCNSILERLNMSMRGRSRGERLSKHCNRMGIRKVKY